MDGHPAVALVTAGSRPAPEPPMATTDADGRRGWLWGDRIQHSGAPTRDRPILLGDVLSPSPCPSRFQRVSRGVDLLRSAPDPGTIGSGAVGAGLCGTALRGAAHRLSLTG